MSASYIAAFLALPLFLASLSPTPMLSQPSGGIVSLAALRGHARPLLIFAPTLNDPQLQIQLRELHDNASAIADRDLVVITLPYNRPSPTQIQLTKTDADAARRRFHIAPSDFAVILIGKDGGDKLRALKPLSVEKLRDTIDAMPMRQHEMRIAPHN